MDVFTTGDEVTVDLEKDTLTNHSTGEHDHWSSTFTDDLRLTLLA